MEARGRREGRLALSAAALVVAASTGCAAAEARVTWRPPDRAELAEARRRLDDLRGALGARTEEIAIAFEAPLLPGAIRARGAIAVEPHRAARVVLLGPGGTTAADLWLDRTRHRLAIPARDEITRGERGDAVRGVPLELFRSWFLEPLEGELLDASVDGDRLSAVLRTADGIVFVRSMSHGALELERVPRAAVAAGDEPDVERIHAERGVACGRVTYERPRVGVRAEIVCSSRRPGARAEALADPDRGPP